MGWGDFCSKKLQGEWSIYTILWIIQILYPDIYLIFIIVPEFARKKKDLSALKVSRPFSRIFNPTGAFFINQKYCEDGLWFELIAKCGIDMQGKKGLRFQIRREESSPIFNVSQGVTEYENRGPVKNLFVHNHEETLEIIKFQFYS